MASSASVGAQLWAKDLPLDVQIHRFTVGRDPELDLALYGFDCQASAAHVRALVRANLLSGADANALLPALAAQFAKHQAGQITITPEQEDCHTALEAALVAATGDAGKRIHLGRSRNDQVLVALRLFLRAQLASLSDTLLQLAQCLHDFANAHQAITLPGFTHMRRAMPSSFGQWGAGFAEALCEELDAAAGLYARIDRCPLGAAAGFGAPLALQREYSAALLGFSRVQRAPTDCMNSRGRHEQAMLDWCVSIAGNLEKLLWDLALFSSDEFGYLSLPVAFTTGSSIMPQKRNPDVVELARAKCRALRGISETHRQIMTGLPSNYHRDFQLGKAPLIEGLALMHELLAVLIRLIPALQLHPERAQAQCSDELYAAHAAYLLVAEGLPFRDAYKVIATQLADGNFTVPESLRAGTLAPEAVHTGHPQKLDLAALQAEIDAHTQRRAAQRNRIAEIEMQLWRSEA